jgi:hypothetical protein
MVENGEGRKEYVRRRFLEAVAPEDVERIRKELIVDEDIPRGTVDTVKNEMKKRGELPVASTEASLVTLKRQFPQRLGRYDVLTPEAVLQELRLQDGDYKVGFVDGIAMLLLAARLNQELATTQAQAMTPMISMLQALREEERQAAERAKSSSLDIAREAAQDAVGGVLGYIDQKLPKGPPPKDAGELITKRIDKMWDMMEHMMEQRLMPGYAANQPPEGWEYERKPVMTAQGAAQGTPGGWETEQRKEGSDVQSSDVRGQSPADAAGEGGGTAPQDGDNQAPPAGAA